MLDRQKHEHYLKLILRDIVKNYSLHNNLALKGGTCLYLFYKLPRFSVDLDFDVIGDGFDFNQLDLIIKQHIKIQQSKKGKNGYLWRGSFQKGRQQIEIDVNIRKYPDKYENKQFYGLSLNTLSSASMFAHKLCAIMDRTKIMNRDLFDSWYMFKQEFDINKDIIKFRTNMSVVSFLKQLKAFISDQVNQAQILHGLGELVNYSQKTWIKTNLLDELLFQIQLEIEKN